MSSNPFLLYKFEKSSYRSRPAKFTSPAPAMSADTLLNFSSLPL